MQNFKASVGLFFKILPAAGETPTSKRVGSLQRPTLEWCFSTGCWGRSSGGVLPWPRLYVPQVFWIRISKDSRRWGYPAHHTHTRTPYEWGSDSLLPTQGAPLPDLEWLKMQSKTPQDVLRTSSDWPHDDLLCFQKSKSSIHLQKI